MQPEQQAHVAGVVRDCREHLQGVLSGRNGGVDPKQLEAIAARLEDVETALDGDARHRRRRSPLRRLQELSASRMTPVPHHPPEPLKVPRRYLRTSPPSPAPGITIVTPSFQQGRFLERTILSVLDQSYPALEYVVRDGGSTDETLDVLHRHTSSLTHWDSAPDAGQANAINLGFDESTGEIMAFLNSDDLLLPGSLAYVARYFARHPEVDVVYGHRILIDEGDRQVGVWLIPARAERVLRWSDCIPQETLFWRRRAWEAAGGKMDEGFNFALDWDLLLRFREAGCRMQRLPRFLGAFRLHTHQKNNVLLDAYERESTALRVRANGHPVSPHVAHARLQPFVFRHALLHCVNRAWWRLPVRRFEVPVAGLANYDSESGLTSSSESRSR
jgi:glycosyltransferase involved in cell wall biosynthesis